MLIKGFERSCPPREVRPPEWDVSLVLDSLKKAPYEPLREATVKHLTHKTVFLLALASAKRVGELHGTSYRVRHAENWASLSFSFVPEFVAKTQDPSVPDERFEGFSVPALRGSTDRRCRLLCPVRAVREYLKRTRHLRPDCRRLFVTTGGTKKTVSRNTISYWLRQAIIRAYELSGRGDTVPRIRAHEVRGIGPTLLFRKNAAVGPILRAGTWKRHSTFTRHYLRDVAHKSLDTYSLGPVVAAQSII